MRSIDYLPFSNITEMLIYFEIYFSAEKRRQRKDAEKPVRRIRKERQAWDQIL